MHLCLAVECIASSLHFCSTVCLFSINFTNLIKVSTPRPQISPPPVMWRPSLHCFARQYLLQWFVFPFCHTATHRFLHCLPITLNQSGGQT